MDISSIREWRQSQAKRRRSATLLVLLGLGAVALLAGILVVILTNKSSKSKHSSGIGSIAASGRMVPLKTPGSLMGGHYLFVWAQPRLLNGSLAPGGWWLVDSGSSYTFVGEEYARQNGIEASGQIAVPAGVTKIMPTAQIGGFSIATQDDSPALSLGPHKVVLEKIAVIKSVGSGLPNVVGSLGMPLLREFNLIIDYRPGQQPVFASKDRIVGGSQVPIVVTTGTYPLIMAPVKVNGKDAGSWIVDLGSDQSIMTSGTAIKLNLPPDPSARITTGNFATGPVQMHQRPVQLGIGNTPPVQIDVDIPVSKIAGIEQQGSAGDLAADYMRALGRIGLSVKDSKMVIF